ncbi:uncharacterized protein LOC108696918 [Xenopus laevis]|uniref:Uncharacterized protein LOC108696918 n=2 Tax=Xenopus laevis TaxID=8355 RepID=A0A1L8FPP1_XENLA|nr:uncharacterized protein LOC108696918 [Xenopus laevis]OCT73564.1 hypothetical protein XELAEV_18036543mg [Xenopus laevis]
MNSSNCTVTASQGEICTYRDHIRPWIQMKCSQLRYISRMAFWVTCLLIHLLILSQTNPTSAQDSGTNDAPPEIKCPPNMIFRGCKRSCFSTCDNLNRTSENCYEPCTLDCDCMDGFVFQSAESSVCVEVSACKFSCPANMRFDPCLKINRRTCAMLNTAPILYPSCMPRCVCDEGYVIADEREENPKCIKISECSKISSD